MGKFGKYSIIVGNDIHGDGCFSGYLYNIYKEITATVRGKWEGTWENK